MRRPQLKKGVSRRPRLAELSVVCAGAEQALAIERTFDRLIAALLQQTLTPKKSTNSLNGENVHDERQRKTEETKQ